MLTGFHGFHVTLGVTMLIVILFRCVAGHFRPDHHFGFEAVSWYWHFVDVVWLLLFIFVYWMWRGRDEPAEKAAPRCGFFFSRPALTARAR